MVREVTYSHLHAIGFDMPIPRAEIIPGEAGGSQERASGECEPAHGQAHEDEETPPKMLQLELSAEVADWLTAHPRRIDTLAALSAALREEGY